VEKINSKIHSNALTVKEKNFKGKLTTLDDFRLKCCIEGQKSKNEITGSNLRKRDLNIPPNDIPVGPEFMVTSLKTR
jgi:hypothetical protein